MVFLVNYQHKEASSACLLMPNWICKDSKKNSFPTIFASPPPQITTKITTKKRSFHPLVCEPYSLRDETQYLPEKIEYLPEGLQPSTNATSFTCKQHHHIKRKSSPIPIIPPFFSISIRQDAFQPIFYCTSSAPLCNIAITVFIFLYLSSNSKAPVPIFLTEGGSATWVKEQQS